MLNQLLTKLGNSKPSSNSNDNVIWIPGLVVGFSISGRQVINRKHVT